VPLWASSPGEKIHKHIMTLKGQGSFGSFLELPSFEGIKYTEANQKIVLILLHYLVHKCFLIQKPFYDTVWLCKFLCTTVSCCWYHSNKPANFILVIKYFRAKNWFGYHRKFSSKFTKKHVHIPKWSPR